MNVLLTKAHDITRFASTDPMPYTLQGVYLDVEGRRLIATNGRILVRLSVIDGGSVESPEPSAKAKTCIIPADALRRILAAIPNATVFPAGNYAAVHCNGERVELIVNNQGNKQVNSETCIVGNYPNTDRLFPATPVTASFALTSEFVALLGQFAQFINETSTNPGIRFYVRGEYDPIQMEATLKDGIIVEALIMPMKMTA